METKKPLPGSKCVVRRVADVSGVTWTKEKKEGVREEVCKKGKKVEGTTDAEMQSLHIARVKSNCAHMPLCQCISLR